MGTSYVRIYRFSFVLADFQSALTPYRKWSGEQRCKKWTVSTDNMLWMSMFVIIAFSPRRNLYIWCISSVILASSSFLRLVTVLIAESIDIMKLQDLMRSLRPNVLLTSCLQFRLKNVDS